MLLSYAGDLYTVGNNWYGQLGQGVRESTRCNTPTQVVSFHSSFIQHIAASDNMTVASTSEGELFTWGAATPGPIGWSDYKAPQRVLIPPDIQTDDQEIVDLAISRGCITVCMGYLPHSVSQRHS